MFGLGKSSNSTQPTYFDIRLKSTYKNLIIVRGSHYESPSVVVSGDLVFSLPESLTVKKIGLKLTGRYKLDFLEVLEQKNSTISNPVKEETVIFEATWDNLLVNADGVITTDRNSNTNTGVSTSSSHRNLDFINGIQNSLASLDSSGSSSTLLNTPLWNSILAPEAVPSRSSTSPLRSHHNSSTSLSHRLIRSQTPLQLHLQENGVSGTPFNHTTTPSGTTFILPGGNYELPFKCILPGDIPETVEGLMAGSILYKFEAVTERAGFNKSPITRHKYFRILRTLSSDNLSLNETVSIGKSWPDKVQYEVGIPSRAVPIGGLTPINILLIPLAKGMKLGLVRAQIIQYFCFTGITGEVYDDEQCCLDCTLSQMEGTLIQDKISIDSTIKIPSNLKKVTQDCDFKNDLIKVRHKLKLQINLIMPNGNISELRANLPITLFISPNVEMTGRLILLDKHGKIHFRKEEDKLFEKNKVVNRGNGNETSSNGNDDGFVLIDRESAPPNYDEHIFDRILFGENNSNVVQSQHVLPPDVETDSANDYFGNFSDTEVFDSNFDVTNPTSGTVTPTELATLQKRVESLKFDKLSDIPSYNEAMENDDPNPSEEFSPSYHKIVINGNNQKNKVARPIPARPSSLRVSSTDNVGIITARGIASTSKSPTSRENGN